MVTLSSEPGYSSANLMRGIKLPEDGDIPQPCPPDTFLQS